MSQIPSLSQVSMSSGMRVPDARLPNVPTGQIAAGIASAGDSIGRAMIGIGADAMQQESALELLEATAEFEKRKADIITKTGKEPSLITRSALIRSGLDQAREDIAGGFKGEHARRRFSVNAKSSTEDTMVKINEAISQQHREQFSTRALLSARQVFNSGNLPLSRKMLDAGIEQGFIDAKTGEESWFDWNRERETIEINSLVQVNPKAIKSYKAAYAGDRLAAAVALVDMRETLSMQDAGRSRDYMQARAVVLDGVAKNLSWDSVVGSVENIISSSSYKPDELETVRRGLLGDMADLQVLNDLASGKVKSQDELSRQPYHKYLSNESVKRAAGVFASPPDDSETPKQRDLAMSLEYDMVRGDTQVADPVVLWGLAESGEITKQRAIHLIRVGMSMSGDGRQKAAAIDSVNNNIAAARVGRPVPSQHIPDVKKANNTWYQAEKEAAGNISLADIMPTDPAKPSTSFNKLVDRLVEFVGTHHYLPEDAKNELVDLMNGGLEHHAYQAATLLSKFVDPSSGQARNGTAGMVSSQIGAENVARALYFRKLGKPGALQTARDAEEMATRRIAHYDGNFSGDVRDKMENKGSADSGVYTANREFMGLAIQYAKEAFGSVRNSSVDHAVAMGYEKAKAEYQVVDGKLMHLSPFAHVPYKDRYLVYDKIFTVAAAKMMNLHAYNKDGLSELIESNGFSAGDVKRALAAGRHAWKPAAKTLVKGVAGDVGGDSPFPGKDAVFKPVVRPPGVSMDDSPSADNPYGDPPDVPFIEDVVGTIGGVPVNPFPSAKDVSGGVVYPVNKLIADPGVAPQGSWEELSKLDLLFFSVMQGIPAKSPGGKQLGIDENFDPTLKPVIEEWRRERTRDLSVTAQNRAEILATGFASARGWYNETGRKILADGRVSVAADESGLKWTVYVNGEAVVDIDNDSSFPLAAPSRSDRFYIPNPEVDAEGGENDPSLWYRTMKPVSDVVKPVVDEAKRRPADTMNWTGLQ